MLRSGMAEKDIFSLCIVSCEHYQSAPIKGFDQCYSQFRASEIESVPVIRIFGITPAGQKACLHIHGVFPYISVPYEGPSGPQCQQYMQELATNIDNTLNFGFSKKMKQHVFKIEHFTAIPFYGYHQDEQEFLRIFFYNPWIAKKVIELLHAGSIMNTANLQPHEAHIPYILQFFIDFNLHGMNFIELTKVKFRIFPLELRLRPLTSPLNLDGNRTCSGQKSEIAELPVWDPDVMDSDLTLSAAKISSCELEVDCKAEDIRRQENDNACCNPGLAAIWEEERKRHKEKFNESKVTPVASQDRSGVQKTESEIFFLAKLKEKLLDIQLKSSNSSSQNYFFMDKSLTESQNAEDMEFLEMLGEMLTAEDADSILSTQRSFQDPEQVESSDDEELKEIFWPDDLEKDSGDLVDDNLPEKELMWPSSESSLLQAGQTLASSGSSILQAGQISRSGSRQDEVEEDDLMAGCSFWLTQLDGKYDRTPKKVELRRSARRKREDPRDVPPPKTECFSSSTLLNSLPPPALDLILRNSVRIPKCVELEALKKLGSEKIQLDRISTASLKRSDQKSSQNSSQKKTMVKKFGEGKINQPLKKTEDNCVKKRKTEEETNKLFSSVNRCSDGHSNDASSTNGVISDLDKEIKNYNMRPKRGTNREQLIDKCLVKEKRIQKNDDPGSVKKTISSRLSRNRTSKQVKDQLRANESAVKSTIAVVDEDSSRDALWKLSFLSPPSSIQSSLPSSLPLPNSPLAKDEELFFSNSQEDVSLYLSSDESGSEDKTLVLKKPTDKESSPVLQSESDVDFNLSGDPFTTKSNYEQSPLNNTNNSLQILNRTKRLTAESFVSASSVESKLRPNLRGQTFSGKASDCLVLEAPKGPSWSQVEHEGYPCPIRTNKINKQGFTDNISELEEYQSAFEIPSFAFTRESACGTEVLIPNQNPPSFREVAEWCGIEPKRVRPIAESTPLARKLSSKRTMFSPFVMGKPRKLLDSTPVGSNDSYSALEEATPQNSVVEMKQSNQVTESLTLMSLEVHCQTREDLNPDPKLDAINALFYCVEKCGSLTLGVIATLLPEGKITQPLHGLLYLGIPEMQVQHVENEVRLFEQLIQAVRNWDPDVILGYEVELSSWGYVLERAQVVNPDFCASLSRIPQTRGLLNRPLQRLPVEEADETPEIKLPGRIVLNVWRLMRKEVALTSYTIENVIWHVLKWRIPLHNHATRTIWFKNNRKFWWDLVEHFAVRVIGSLRLLEHFNVIGRTAELARLFGIQFYEVLSRGSQFRVESMMLRIAHSLSYIAVSCSVNQRGHSRAPETLPLILEPESRFYQDPVLVLDFQSLYPSIVIAYNYCYSTCLGRVEHLGKDGSFEFGCTSLTVPLKIQKKLEDDVTISPVGVAFVTPTIRKGVLPRMLDEILNTRIMIKKSMKDYKDDKVMQKVLDARQLGLKLISNVTYGYTGANYSGRMPCVEVADSILSKSRETLQRAIDFVETNSKWKAHVVYGDTDSMFVLLPGRTKAEAFKVGREIAQEVTELNPPPVKLKFEKVYLPCVLQTKKRYVGQMFESEEEVEGTFDAKGIETVRRDGCPAASKILEKSLKMLFSSGRVSGVKLYVQRQFQKLLSGRIPLQELIFAKEYRGLRGYKPTAHVPALVIAKRRLQHDPRSDPRVGERVPYIIVYGHPGLPLIRLVHEPQDLIADQSLRPNLQYYVTRVVVPPLVRIFSLMGEDIHKWLSDLPRLSERTSHGPSTGGLFSYLNSDCPNCKGSHPELHEGPCPNCQRDPQQLVVDVYQELNQREKSYHRLIQLCQSCSGAFDVSCVSIDCPVLFRVAQSKRDLNASVTLAEKIDF